MKISIDVITTRREIYKAMLESEENQSIVGISCNELGPGMFMTTVKEVIEQSDDFLIVLNSYDLTGYFLEKNKVLLSKITGVIPFKAVFTNPFLKETLEKGIPKSGEAACSADYLF